MGTTRIEVSGDDQLTRALGRYAGRLGDWHGFWPEVEDAFQRREQIWMRREGEGTWPPLSPRYSRSKGRQRPGRPLLVYDGTLRDILTSDRSVIARLDRELVIGTSESGAGYHMTGTRNMPARRPVPPMVRLAGGIAQRLRLYMDWQKRGVLA